MEREDPMAHISQAAAQRRADRIRQFGEELDCMEKEGVVALSPPQRSAIETYHQRLIADLVKAHDVDRDQRGKRLSLGMRLASFLGALALAASIFFLFYQFWGRLSTTLQVVILMGTPIMALSVTMIVAGREATGYFSKIAGLVTIACFVLNLVMLGRIFNITPSENAFFVWAVFAFLLAYATDARLLLAAGIIALSCFISARVGVWAGCYWIYFGQRPENFLPVALALFLIPVLIPHRRYADFPAIYRVFAMLLFFIAVLILANWGRISYFDFPTSLIEGSYQVLGFVVSALAIGVGLRLDWPDVVNTGNVFFVIFLYTKFFDWWWDVMPKYLFFFVIGLTAILALIVFKRLRAATELQQEVTP